MPHRHIHHSSARARSQPHNHFAIQPPNAQAENLLWWKARRQRHGASSTSGNVVMAS